MPIPGETLVAAIVIAVALILIARLLMAVPDWLRQRRRPEARSIRVIGVGGGGGNAVDRMVEARIPSVGFVACNTDAQALRQSSAGTKIRIGDAITRGLGAGGDPEIGRRAAEENEEIIARSLVGADLVFVTAGLGGGTGSGGAPVVAAIARDQGALTIAVVTKPFGFEGAKRERVADAAATELLSNVDALIVVPNDRIGDVLDEEASLVDAFAAVDDILLQAVRGIIDLITAPGLINLDFADVAAVMKDAGPALIGIGRGSGPNRAVDAARQAIDSPLLEASIEGARGVLFNVAGPPDLRLREVRLAADEIRARADIEANVIFGASFRQPQDAELLITLVATGLTGQKATQPRPVMIGGRTSTSADVAAARSAGVSASSGSAANGAPARPRRRGGSTTESVNAAEPINAAEPPGPEPDVAGAAQTVKASVSDRLAERPDDGTAERPVERPAERAAERESPRARLDERDLDVPSFLRRRSPGS